MFPIEFDRQILSSLPTPSEASMKKVMNILQSMLAQRIIPYFRNRRGSDLIQLARVKQGLSIARMEDEEDRVLLVSVLGQTRQGWTVYIHEHIFDYLAFVIPLKAEFSLGDSSVEERRMLTVAEFFLRHNVEHLLYPDKKERDVIQSDIDFAMEWRSEDPTAYKMLRSAFEDEMNGISGRRYLELLKNAEKGASNKFTLDAILSDYVDALSELPEDLLLGALTFIETGIKALVLGECYSRSQKQAFSLVKRASSLKKFLRLFKAISNQDSSEGIEIFRSFKSQWGLIELFQEIELPVKTLEEKNADDLFALFRSKLESLPDSPPKKISPFKPHQTMQESAPEANPVKPKSLKERIEDARNDALFPPAVLDLIEKNKSNAAGQSGAKYSELIETLLTIPWNQLRRIWVSTEEFEEGLNRSHYGLQKPKEIICDFFANLIWRYQHFNEEERKSWKRTGSALLFVGPPGVGKTSLAISIAKNLGIPYHKISLGGMKDEADIRGYGFTYEGSKPGPIVQGLIKMGTMNGMFILDEVDKTEKFAVSTLLEILDPEQNHMFHDKYTQTTVDIDLSNAHFVLTANTLETVPPPILNRCEVIFLDRYSIEEKISIARSHLINRVRDKYMIGENEIFFEPLEEGDILRHLIRNYTSEAGVRDLERILRTLFLRVHRKEVLGKGRQFVRLTSEKIHEHLDEPDAPRLINAEDRTGEMMGLGVNMEMGVGSLIPIQVTPIRRSSSGEGDEQGSYLSMVHATGNLEKVMDESRKVASTAILHVSESLGIDTASIRDSVHLHFMGGSTKKDGPSAGGAIALALASLYLKKKIRRDVAMTGEIDTQGRISGIGGLGVKLETAYGAGVKTMIIPRDNLRGTGSIERLPEALKGELQILTYKEWKESQGDFDYGRHVMQVVAVDNIVQAADVAFIDDEAIDSMDEDFESHARISAAEIRMGHSEARSLRILQVPDPTNLDPEVFASDFCNEGYGCILMVQPDKKKELLSRVPEGATKVEVRTFDPARDSLAAFVEEIRKPLLRVSDKPLQVSIVAPQHFLKRDGINAEEFPSTRQFAGLRLFADCCTIENVGIKECQSTVSQVIRELALLSEETLEQCPFIASKDGIHSITLSFIPEKYRLDIQRSEEILERNLLRWLNVVKGKESVEESRKLNEKQRKVLIR